MWLAGRAKEGRGVHCNQDGSSRSRAESILDLATNLVGCHGFDLTVLNFFEPPLSLSEPLAIDFRVGSVECLVYSIGYGGPLFHGKRRNLFNDLSGCHVFSTPNTRASSTSSPGTAADSTGA